MVDPATAGTVLSAFGGGSSPLGGGGAAPSSAESLGGVARGSSGGSALTGAKTFNFGGNPNIQNATSNPIFIVGAVIAIWLVTKAVAKRR